MGFVTWKIYLKICAIINGEEGQDLVEYALILSLIALGAVVGFRTFAYDLFIAILNVTIKFNNLWSGNNVPTA